MLLLGDTVERVHGGGKLGLPTVGRAVAETGLPAVSGTLAGGVVMGYKARATAKRLVAVSPCFGPANSASDEFQEDVVHAAGLGGIDASSVRVTPQNSGLGKCGVYTSGGGLHEATAGGVAEDGGGVLLVAAGAERRVEAAAEGMAFGVYACNALQERTVCGEVEAHEGCTAAQVSELLGGSRTCVAAGGSLLGAAGVGNAVLHTRAMEAGTADIFVTSGVYNGGPADTGGERISLAGVVARGVSVVCGVAPCRGAACVCEDLAGHALPGGDAWATASAKRSKADCGLMSQTGAATTGRLCGLQSGGAIGPPSARHCGTLRMQLSCAGIGGVSTRD